MFESQRQKNITSHTGSYWRLPVLGQIKGTAKQTEDTGIRKYGINSI